MRAVPGIGLREVQAVYDGPEGELWELVMGQQIHVGGLRSSMDLAERANIGAGMCGVDLCCCNGAGMRLLVRFRQVASMIGVDGSETVVTRGRARCEAEGFGDRVRFVLADACESGLPSASVDFVWGEDAWCYVADKPRLIAEAARIAKAGGVLAFTDWIEGPTPLTDREAEFVLRCMKFPNLEDLEGYARLLTDAGCEVVAAEDTGRFARHLDLYLDMLDLQLTYDALRIIGFDASVLQKVAADFARLRDLAHAGKLAQARFVARKGRSGA